MSPKKPKKVSIFKKLELFLTRYKSIISLLFGLFGIAFGFYKGHQANSYKNNIEYTTKILDSTRDANGILTTKTVEITLKMNDLKKISDSGDAKIRELLAEINEAYKNKNKTAPIIGDTLMVSYIKHDTIVKIVHDTIIPVHAIKNDTLKDTMKK